MPQGRRKIPFSGKAKKAQIQMKKLNAAQEEKKSASVAKFGPETASRVVTEGAKDITSELTKGVKLGSGSGGGKSRYELRFQSETPEELFEAKTKAAEHLGNEYKSLETPSESMYPPQGIDFPVRPQWSASMSKHALEIKEENFFEAFEEDIFAKWGSSLSYFELNLETWRQLWRVMEMSDVLLLVVDVRYAPAMIPPSLFRVVKENGKDLIIVLNKVDLIPPPLVLAWREYIQNEYPGVYVALFTSCPTYNLARSDALSLHSKYGLQSRRLRGNISMAAEGAKGVLEACKEIVCGSNVNLDSWEEKVSDALEGRSIKTSIESVKEPSTLNKGRFADGILTIGMIGQPNVGKSSLINSLLGKKAVSVSRTPGHTKHFQTMFISESVKLCDCPGLVFPSLVPKPLQIMMGSFPIAQVRAPYLSVRFIAERVDLPTILKINHVDEEDTFWTPLEICEAWAIKRCYRTAKSNRPDIHRASNHILRMTLEGKIPLWLTPPGYKPEDWETKEDDLKEVLDLLGLTAVGKDHEELREEEEDDCSSHSEDESQDEGPQRKESPLPPKTSNKFSALMSALDSDNE